VLTRRRAFAAVAAVLDSVARAAPSAPGGLRGPHKLVANWTFGGTSPGTAVCDKAQLDQAFRYRFIYDDGQLDRLTNCWSV